MPKSNQIKMIISYAVVEVSRPSGVCWYFTKINSEKVMASIKVEVLPSSRLLKRRIKRRLSLFTYVLVVTAFFYTLMQPPN